MFKFYFKSKVKVIIIWTIFLTVFLFASLTKYDTFASDIEGTKQLMDSFPRVIKVVYGMNDIDITTIGGYFSVVSLYITIIIGIYAGILGSKIIYEEEDLMTSEFIFTRPVSRSKVYFTKLIVAFVSITLLNIFVIGANYLILKTQYELFDEFILLGILQYVICILALAIGLFFSSLKNNRFATVASAGIVTILFLIRTYGELKEINFSYITPFYAFSYSNIINDFNIIYVIYYVIIAIVLVVLGNIILNKRDIK